MKSIYSLPTLQRIIDHWQIGKIEDVTYFQSVGRNIWRHLIDTNQGEFELFSYPPDSHEYAQERLTCFFEEHHFLPPTDPSPEHAFDRYHVLQVKSRKYKISSSQAAQDLVLLINLGVKKAFRVYGTILQMELENKHYVISYAHWKIRKNEETLADSWESLKDDLDAALDCFAAQNLRLLGFQLQNEWFTLQFDQNITFCFSQDGKFPAAEIHIPIRKNDILIFSEEKIFYTREVAWQNSWS